MVRPIRNEKELENCIKDIEKRLYITNHYLQEWECLMIYSSKDNGKKYQEYNLLFKYLRDAYLKMVFININIIFDRNSLPNIYRVNEYISKQNVIIKKLNFNIEFDDVRHNICKIRNKAIAHIDDIEINNLFKKFRISKKQIDDIIFYINERIKCFIFNSELNIIKSELIYLEGEGIEAVLNLLPDENKFKKTAKGIRPQKAFNYINELYTA